MTESKIHDLCIIGLGAVGLYACFCANLLELKGHGIEAHARVGGQVYQLAGERLIRDLPAIPATSGAAIIKLLNKQINSIPKTITQSLKTTAINLEKANNYYILKLNNQTINTKTILITTGNGSYVPRPWAIKPMFGNVYYFIKHHKTFKNKTVVVCGGGDSALNAALELSSGDNAAKKIILLHRNNQFRAKAQTIAAVKNNPRIYIMVDYKIAPTKYISHQKNLKSIYITNYRNEGRQLKADAFIIQYGLTINLMGIEKWPLKFSSDFKILVNQKQQTSLPGVFAAGDIAYYKGKTANLVVGFGEAATALYNISYSIKGYDPIKYFGDHMLS